MLDAQWLKSKRICCRRLAPKRKALEFTSSGRTVSISNSGEADDELNLLIKSITGFCHEHICRAKSAKARHSWKKQ
jgi:hypothetical protein